MFCKVMTNICSATLYWQLAAALLVTNPVCDDSLTNSHGWDEESQSLAYSWRGYLLLSMFWDVRNGSGNFMLPTNVLFGLKVSQSVFNLETHPIYRQISWEILKLLVTISYFLKCWLAAGHLIERGLIRLLSLGIGWWSLTSGDSGGDISPLSPPASHCIWSRGTKLSDPENGSISWQDMLGISETFLCSFPRPWHWFVM